MAYKLCDKGKLLFERYCEVAELYGQDDPRTTDAWKAWMLHKRGTAETPGCPRCSGLKGKGDKNE